MLYFEEGYSESLGARIKMPDNLTDRTLNISDVNIWQDMSSKIILYCYNKSSFYFLRNWSFIVTVYIVVADQYVSNLLRRDMLSRYVMFLQSVFRDCNWPIALADIPIKVIFEHFCSNNSIIICFFIVLFSWKTQFTEITTRVSDTSQLQLLYHCWFTSY